MVHTGGDVVERDAGGRESMLNVKRETSGVAVSGDGEGTVEVGIEEGGGDVLSYGVGVEVSGDLTVFYVPPD
ncbi:hypothetical protein A2U01_0064822 [Trifolium medium]|uniref:Uncharacterized protein n=1 Tax=Trifolium medium TaxID=97028 RepID=A0A392S6R8_9FABA|nr:hypothetical protein [Trifolium medium]